MVKKLLLTLGMIILFSSLAFSQSGKIQGTVTDQTGGAIEFANVFLKKDGNLINYVKTDAEGNYQIFGVAAGTFDLEVDATLITTCPVKSVKSKIKVNSGETFFADFKLNCGSEIITTVDIVWVEPVFRPDNTKSSQVMNEDDIRRMPGNSITSALASSEGVVSIDGSMTSVRGSRSDGQKTEIDGISMRGTGGVSMASIEQVELIQGGIPAEYGDGTSFTVITTKGISKDFHGSVELMGSLEGYNNFFGSASLTGPLLRGKKSTDPARIGFLITGDVSYDKDPYPAQGGTWRATDEAIDYLIKNPIRYSNINFGANYASGEYLTEESFEKQRVRDNASQWNYLLQGKIDFLAGKDKNINLSVGGMYEFTRVRNWGIGSALFNADNNSQTQNTTWRVNAKLNHRIKVDTNSKFDNIMYDINVNFTKVDQWTRDINHKENYFDYGHIGYYKTTKAQSFRRDSITIDGITYYDMNIYQGDYDSIVEFSPMPFGSNDESLISNPDLVPYVTNFTNYYTPNLIYDYYGEGFPYNKTLYQSFGALLNGETPNNPYSLFSSPAAVYNGYSKTEETQIGAKASLSMSIKKHDIKLGYIFEKRSSRAFSIAPVALWTLMRSSVNQHFKDLDLDNPYIVGNSDTVMFNNQLVLADQTNFDRQLRTSMGLDPNGTDWIDVDNMSPDAFNINMFSAEELFNGGSNLISYYGYDYTGTKKYNQKTSIQDFFTKEDANGNKTYNIGAYEPIYMAMYIQDKFSINTLLFNIGLRVDRFDANQSVLSDPYLFRASETVKDVKGSFSNIPSNAQDDWVVYVNQLDKTLDPENSSIVAFRSGHTWYNAEGQEISDPSTVLGATGGPILKKALPDSQEKQLVSKVDYDAFTDYKPQWSIMPRLSFSFPVSTKSLFYAHYNIITSRPTNLRLDPISYLWIEKLGSSANNTISNPNLKPQRSIDYEIGFRQAIGENSAISLAAYYSEKRDQIQAFRYTGAYPSTYYSYDNIDFGTVQGFTLSYNMRRTKNVTLRASYTLQFAKGTGSSETSGLSIIANGQPNLRTLTNLSFDQRHRLSANIDYRFGSGIEGGPAIKKEKDGKVKEIKIFENMGININFSAGSGLPYTRSSKPYSTYVSGTKSQLSGTINGSNMPWIYQCDVRIDKTFILGLKKNEQGEATKKAYLNIYFEVMNIFNFKNIIYVYEYTGNADDDGYLSSSEYQQQINSQVSVASYSNYYRMRMTDPYNYTMPTRVHLGVQFTF